MKTKLKTKHEFKTLSPTTATWKDEHVNLDNFMIQTTTDEHAYDPHNYLKTTMAQLFAFGIDLQRSDANTTTTTERSQSEW